MNGRGFHLVCGGMAYYGDNAIFPHGFNVLRVLPQAP
jgi:hypothetical protein